MGNGGHRSEQCTLMLLDEVTLWKALEYQILCLLQIENSLSSLVFCLLSLGLANIK